MPPQRPPGRALPHPYAALTRIAHVLVVVLVALVGPASSWAGELSDSAPSLRGEEPAFSVDSPLGAIVYRAGRGLRVGDTGLNLGGFTTFEYDREENGEGEIDLDSVSFLMLWEPVARFRAFAELELDGLYTYDTKENESTSNVQTNIERAYGEFRFSDPLRVRVGKFQTPIGRWNLVPAEPFVWTASTPVIAEAAFDEHQTGAAVQGALYRRMGTLHYWIYGQATDPIDPSDDPEPADYGAGARLQWDDPRGRLSVATSYLAAETLTHWSHLAGFDAELVLGPLALTNELTLVRGDAPVRDLWGTYLQGVLDVGYGFHVVARFEYFDPVADEDVSLLDAGLAWNPLPWLRVKADYRIATRTTDFVTRGVSTSLSAIF